MKTLFLKLWNDDAFFTDAALKLGRLGVGLLGVLVEWNVIPTGIDGGSKYGLLGVVLAAMLPSRTQKAIQKIAEPPKP